MGEKIDKEVNQDGPDKGCEEEGTFEGSEKGLTKDAKLLKMLILN